MQLIAIQVFYRINNSLHNEQKTVALADVKVWRHD